MATILTAGMVVLGTSCGSAGISGPGPASELQANRSKWDDAGFSSYRFQFRRSCFCANTNLVRITVIDGNITQVTDLESETDLDPSEFQFYETVAGLFAIVGEALEDADSLVVSYDADLGYPTEIDIDYIAEAIDDEVRLTASDVDPLPSDGG